MITYTRWQWENVFFVRSDKVKAVSYSVLSLRAPGIDGYPAIPWPISAIVGSLLFSRRPMLVFRYSHISSTKKQHLCDVFWVLEKLGEVATAKATARGSITRHASRAIHHSALEHTANCASIIRPSILTVIAYFRVWGDCRGRVYASTL